MAGPQLSCRFGRKAKSHVLVEQLPSKLMPLSEMFGYVTQLRTITSGRASSTMEFSHYAECPKNIAEEVIDEQKAW
ncbi:MAG: hypothetical protein R2788_05860 [Saprospiraceae bacterium]